MTTKITCPYCQGVTTARTKSDAKSDHFMHVKHAHPEEYKRDYVDEKKKMDDMRKQINEIRQGILKKTGISTL